MKLLDAADILFTTSSEQEDDVMQQLDEYLNNMYFAN